jgi:hypothetical protein
MFRRFGIRGGIKRVKLATLLYRKQLWLEEEHDSEAYSSPQADHRRNRSDAELEDYVSRSPEGPAASP